MPSATRPRLNPFTALRIASLPVLWACAALGWSAALGLGLAAAALTDVLDGQLARRRPEYADGRFDSAADKLLTGSAALWLVWLQPRLLAEQAGLLLMAAALYAVTLLYGWRKFRRVSALHLYSGKLGGLLQAIFVVHTFLAGAYSPALFYLAVGAFLLAAAEELAVLAAYHELDDEAVRSILPYLRARLGRRT